ncbi:transcription elongation factor TFIIS [Kickxella alabastrina]|uniref:Transcription elongation factor TFIIS n=1 Tax=Kickxella alabastrina TaxID=61397 RepID=A0ACC1IJ81_9FUNG|nr:transcription elongation factor TFIIS [Kickxella alabastrina]
MSEITSKHDELKSLCKALSEAQEAQNKDDLNAMLNKLIAIPVEEKLLRATGAGQVVGRLRNYEDPAIAALAKSVVQKWKKDVMASNSRSNSSTPKVAAATSAAAAAAAATNQKPIPTTAVAVKKQQQAAAAAVASASASAVASSDVSNKSQSPAPSLAAAATTSAAAPDVASKVASAPKPATPGVASGAVRIGPRTAASDKVSVAVSGDSTRNKCIELLYNSIAADSDADSEILLQRSSGIELVEFEKAESSITTTYKSKIRSLCLNLRDKKNPDLRNSVILGIITPKHLCNMTSEEMAPKELQVAIDKMNQENLADARAPIAEVSETDMFRCGRCGNRRCTYYQMQTRSADEPMTTFVTCVVCTNRWRFS